MILHRPRLEHDFDAAAAGTRVLRRIRILIDLDLLNGRRRNVQVVDFDAVDHQRRAVRADCARIEEARHRREHVLVEYRQVLDRLVVDRRRVEIRRGVGLHLGRRVADGHLLGDARQRQRDAKRRRRSRADDDANRRRLKTLEGDNDVVASLWDAIEAKHANRVGRGRLILISRGTLQLDLRSWQHGAGGIDDHARDYIGRRSSWSLRGQNR